jgi:hypothetical protein
MWTIWTHRGTPLQLVSRRDSRIDVLCGLSPLMIFANHALANVVHRIAMHNFGFADAAEIFGLSAGLSAIVAYQNLRLFRQNPVYPYETCRHSNPAWADHR